VWGWEFGCLIFFFFVCGGGGGGGGLHGFHHIPSFSWVSQCHRCRCFHRYFDQTQQNRVILLGRRICQSPWYVHWHFHWTSSLAVRIWFGFYWIVVFCWTFCSRVDWVFFPLFCLVSSVIWLEESVLLKSVFIRGQVEPRLSRQTLLM